MRAVGFSHFGGPEVLEVLDLPDPVPGPGEVRVRVAAAAVNPTDLVLVSGVPTGRFGDLPPPWVPGMDLAGVIDAVGPGVTWQVRDRVMGVVVPVRPGGGAQAERVVLPATSVARVPAAFTLTEASTLPMNGLTALVALDLLGLRPGQTLAVTGAAGTLGGYVVERAAAQGLRVIADASPSDEALVHGFGAEVVVPRGPQMAGAIRSVVPAGVDGLIDGAVIGAPALVAVRDGGGVAAVRDFVGPSERGITIHRVRVGRHVNDAAALDELRRLAEDAVLSLRVAATYTADHAEQAYRRLGAGGVRGRLVIVF